MHGLADWALTIELNGMPCWIVDSEFFENYFLCHGMRFDIIDC